MIRRSISSLGVMSGLLGLTGAPELAAQDQPQHAVQQQIELIARERSPQSEYAARLFVYHIARELSEGPNSVPALTQLKAANLQAYWMEVAQLNVQFDAFQNVMRRDSVRAKTMAVVLATEFEARIHQRSWRNASEAARRTIRSQLEELMTRHFEAEDRLRAMEMQDIERRLAEARAETARRQQRRAELVRWSVDDIIHSAERPD